MKLIAPRLLRGCSEAASAGRNSVRAAESPIAAVLGYTRPPMSRRTLLLSQTACVLVMVAGGLTGCKGSLGGVRVNVTLSGDTQTQCLKAFVATPSGYTAYSANVPRNGENTFTFGIQETADLVGKVTVGVNLYRSADCQGGNHDGDTREVTIERGKIPTLNFTFGPPDGGVEDAGVDDGGADGGCAPSLCTTPPECQRQPATCGAAGCEYSLADAGAPCGDGGVCNGAGQCGTNVCVFQAIGTPCDDGLSCTTGDQCVTLTACQGACPTLPASGCNAVIRPFTCASSGGCSTMPDRIDLPCAQAPSGQCDNAGVCRPWFSFPPSNFPDNSAALTQPTAAWTVLPGSDGGACVIDTGTTPPAPREPGANCGFSGQGQVIPQTDGGVDLAVFAATSLLVPAGQELRFVGSRPAVLAIFGDATILGTVHAAARGTGEAPAGSGSDFCVVTDGTNNREGGPGGSYQTLGGEGGNSSLTCPVNDDSDGIPLRGGCAGGRGGGPAPGDGGIGGGALQLTVAGQLMVGDGGVVSVSGAGGLGGTADNSGGGGGGTGGTILLEAAQVRLVNCAVTSNGGGGGEGGRQTNTTGGNGENGRLDSATPAAGGQAAGTGSGGNGAVNSTNGNNGTNGGGSEGGGGGGGAVGLIRINTPSCTASGAVISGERSGASCN